MPRGQSLGLAPRSAPFTGPQTLRDVRSEKVLPGLPGTMLPNVGISKEINESLR